VLSVINELAGDAIDERRGAAAQLRPGIQHQHTPASFSQRRGGAQAGKAGPNDDDIGRDHARSIVSAQVDAAMNARRGRGIRTVDENTS
jgi:hypothetical protein